MSFGRTPHYIYRCTDRGAGREAGDYCPSVDHVHFGGTYVEWDALAQFVVHLRPSELRELLERGLSVAPEMGGRDFLDALRDAAKEDASRAHGAK